MFCNFWLNQTYYSTVYTQAAQLHSVLCYTKGWTFHIPTLWGTGLGLWHSAKPKPSFQHLKNSPLSCGPDHVSRNGLCTIQEIYICYCDPFMHMAWVGGHHAYQPYPIPNSRKNSRFHLICRFIMKKKLCPAGVHYNCCTILYSGQLTVDMNMGSVQDWAQ